MTTKTPKLKVVESTPDLSTKEVDGATAAGKELKPSNVATMSKKAAEKASVTRILMDEKVPFRLPVGGPLGMDPRTPVEPPKGKKLTKAEIAVLTPPYVLIEGVLVEPENVPKFSIDPKCRNKFFSPQHSYGRVDVLEVGRGEILLDTWKVEINGIALTIHLDQNSTFVQNSVDTPWFKSGRRNKNRQDENNVVLLLNSSSVNDHFRGMTMLENVTSKNNSYRNSTLGVGDNNPGFSYMHQEAPAEAYRYTGFYGYEQDDRYIPGTDQYVENNVVPMVVENSHFVGATIRNSLISSGTYVDVRLDNVEVTISNTVKHPHTSLKGVHSFNARLIGKYIRAHSGEINHTIIESEGNIVLGNFRLLNENIFGKGVELSNKFNYATIELPNGPLSFLRINATEFVLGGGYRYCKQEVIPVGADYQTVREQATKIVKTTLPYQHREEDLSPNDTITNSLIKFVTDSIWSRLKIVRLIDGAVRLEETVNPVKEINYNHHLSHLDGGGYF